MPQVSNSKAQRSRLNAKINAKIGAKIGPKIAFLTLALLAFATPVTSAAPQKFRVLSFNLHGLPDLIAGHRQARLKALVPAVIKLKPDIVAFQELWFPADAEALIQAFKDSPLKHSQRFSDGLTGGGLLTLSRWPIKRAQFHIFKPCGRPWELWHADYYASKGLALLSIQSPAGPLIFGQTHFHARYRSQRYQADQLVSVQIISEALKNDINAFPILLCGDWNAPWPSLITECLADINQLSPAKPSMSIDAFYFKHGPKQSWRQPRLKTLLTEPVQLEDGGHEPLSDHPAVLLEIQLQNGPAAKDKNSKPVQADFKEAISVLREAELLSWWRGAAALALALLYAGLLLLMWHQKAKGSPTRSRLWRRLRIVFATLLVLALLLFLWLGLCFEPSYRQGFKQARGFFEAARKR